MSRKTEMPYTNAFIQELMRFRTLLPLGIPHKANADISLTNYVIPNGTVVKFIFSFARQQAFFL